MGLDGRLKYLVDWQPTILSFTLGVIFTSLHCECLVTATVYYHPEYLLTPITNKSNGQEMFMPLSVKGRQYYMQGSGD